MNLDYLKNYITQIGQPKVLFIWIPKTAGTSIYEAMSSSLNMKRYLKLPLAQKSFTNLGSNTFGHISVDYLLNHGIIKNKYYNNAFKFCISRNPYDRFVSLFYYMKRHNRIPSDFKMIDFIRCIQDGIVPVGGYNFEGLSQCNKQVDWILNIQVDEVFKFENLSEDILKLNKRTGKKINLLHKNKSKQRILDYIDELDQETIKLINKYYDEDFERFSYSKL